MLQSSTRPRRSIQNHSSVLFQCPIPRTQGHTASFHPSVEWSSIPASKSGLVPSESIFPLLDANGSSCLDPLLCHIIPLLKRYAYPRRHRIHALFVLVGCISDETPHFVRNLLPFDSAHLTHPTPPKMHPARMHGPWPTNCSCRLGVLVPIPSISLSRNVTHNP